MGGSKPHLRCLSRFECFLPAGCTQAPLITGLQAGKAVPGHRSRQIVADRFGELEELGGHHGAHGVHSGVAAVGLAAAVAEPTRHWIGAAGDEWFAVDVCLARHDTLTPTTLPTAYVTATAMMSTATCRSALRRIERWA